MDIMKELEKEMLQQLKLMKDNIGNEDFFGFALKADYADRLFSSEKVLNEIYKLAKSGTNVNYFLDSNDFLIGTIRFYFDEQIHSMCSGKHIIYECTLNDCKLLNNKTTSNMESFEKEMLQKLKQAKDNIGNEKLIKLDLDADLADQLLSSKKLFKEIYNTTKNDITVEYFLKDSNNHSRGRISFDFDELDDCMDVDKYTVRIFSDIH